jgi:hypothetical protein
MEYILEKESVPCGGGGISRNHLGRENMTKREEERDM